MSSTAQIVLRGYRQARWSLEVIDVATVIDAVGDRLFAAFMKCFVGVDRLMTLEQLLTWNRQQLPESSVPSDRNLRVLVSLLAGTLYELGIGLQELCNAKVIERLGPETREAAWNRLNQLRGKWRGDARLSKFRNQIGHHLGDSDAYDRGLASVRTEIQPLVPISQGDGDRRHGAQFPLAWDLLLRGQDLDDHALDDVLALTQESHEQLPELLYDVFLDVLRNSGIEIEDNTARPEKAMA